MESSLQTQFDASPAPKKELSHLAWNPVAIVWICLLFSILPAGIMYALNFERLGQPEKKKGALLFVGVISIIFYVIVAVTSIAPNMHPALDKQLRLLCGAFTLSVAACFYRNQKPLFLRHLRQGGKKAALLKPVLLSFIAILIVMASFGYWLVAQEEKKFNRAIVLYEQGEYKDAERLFKSYKVDNPDESGVYLNLALIYLETERPEQAKEELQEVIRLEPQNEEAKDLLQELEDGEVRTGNDKNE
ncbi:MAG TPA: tetratricopeptide repeat protein [Abditibacteriaceae bacterium]